MSRSPIAPIATLLLFGCPWIPDDVHDEFNGDDDDDTTEDVDDCVNEVLYEDQDRDGWGGAEVDACAPPARVSERGGDCDDDNPAVNPDAIEVCDGIDNDCDPDNREDNLATLTNLDSGSRFDVTSTLTSGIAWAPPDTMTNGELNLCSGDFTATTIVQMQGQRLDIAGIGDVTLSPAPDDRTLWVAGGATITVTNLTVFGGTRPDQGGAMVCFGSDLALTDVELVGGTAPNAGGLSASTCDLTAIRTQWSGMAGTGAYIWLQESSVAEITDSTFSGGTGNNAIQMFDSSLAMTDTVFDYQTTQGIVLQRSSDFTATNVDFPASGGQDIVTGSTTWNFSEGYSGLCAESGCSSL